MSDPQYLKRLLAAGDASFWAELARQSKAADSFSDLLLFSKLRKRACLQGGIPYAAGDRPRLRMALVGGSTLYPLSELIEHMLFVSGIPAELFVGDYNNFRSETLDGGSRLYEFAPEVVMILPDEQSCKYAGKLTDAAEMQEQAVAQYCGDLLGLCESVNGRTKGEILLCNFILPCYFDLGPWRAKTPASEWNFRKAVNLALGKRAPYYVHICDLEFLAYRMGGLAAKDQKAWFESKQLCAAPLQVRLAQEAAHMVTQLKSAPKKVLVLDLDNTLWGGVIGDDGMEGIEIGDTSPRGEAFKSFQTYIRSLTERGLLLGVCSKNDRETALEPFQRHPEMVLRESDFVSFKASWDPKPDSLKAMAEELNLGLDSFIFVDDNPAEIEIVRQFTPEVTVILLGEDPSEYVAQLQDSRLFERLSITGEDAVRTGQYREEAQRKALLSTAGDMAGYLRSLEMEGSCTAFNSLDLPRIAQLINKSNQFNLTTKRRSEAELAGLMKEPGWQGFTIRLRDRFGDHGLIAVVICRAEEAVADGAGAHVVCHVDTWLMSCRVLKRQVEEQTLNEIVRTARAMRATRVRGEFLPTAKNGMVRELYPRLGFTTMAGTGGGTAHELEVADWTPFATSIEMKNEER